MFPTRNLEDIFKVNAAMECDMQEFIKMARVSDTIRNMVLLSSQCIHIYMGNFFIKSTFNNLDVGGTELLVFGLPRFIFQIRKDKKH